MKVTVFCEMSGGMEAEAVKKAYPEGMDRCLQGIFGPGTRLISQHEGEDGSALTEEILNDTDVLVWWGHVLHHAVSDEVVERAADRVRRGMGLIVLHSGHMSKIFTRLLGTTCTLKWREDGEKERLWTVAPGHPICAGLPEQFVIPHEEMYGEYFDIPTPDELIFLGWFPGGELFRAGCVFKRGHGKIFYFNAGHESFPNYRQEEVRKVLTNAAGYVCPAQPLAPPFGCPSPAALEKL